MSQHLPSVRMPTGHVFRVDRKCGPVWYAKYRLPNRRQVQRKLAAIRFHDRRHTFGTLAVRGAESIVELQNWLGQAEVRTTMRYTHYREQQDAAARLSKAFQPAVDQLPAARAA